MKITDYLIENHNFSRITKFKEREEEYSIDIDMYTCKKRIGEIHYLFYSEIMKHFDLSIRYDKPKGKAGGGYDVFKKITIPRVIYTEKDADELIMGVVGQGKVII